MTKINQRQYYIMCDEGVLTHPISKRAPFPYDKYMANRREVAEIDQDNCALHDAHRAIGAVYRACKDNTPYAEMGELLDDLESNLCCLSAAHWELCHNQFLLAHNQRFLTNKYIDLRDELEGDRDIDTVNNLIYELHRDVDDFLDSCRVRCVDCDGLTQEQAEELMKEKQNGSNVY